MSQRSEFIVNVVGALKENPRAVLAGHGIKSVVLQTIISRPDVMSKLASLAFSTVYAKKGVGSLKKASNFKISGYASYGVLAGNGPEDVEDFVSGLSPEDQAEFKNDTNIISILILPDTQTKKMEYTDAENTGVVDAIITGKSAMITFDQAVNKAYRTGASMYLTIMWGKSAIRSAEEKIAERKAKVNKAKNAKRTPAKIAQEIKAKFRKKLDKVADERSKLQEKKRATQAQLAQFGQIGKQFGTTGKNSITLAGGMAKYNQKVGSKIEEIKNTIASLDSADKKLFTLATKYMSTGNKRMVNTLLKELNNPLLSEFVLSGAKLPKLATDVLSEREKTIRKQIKTLVLKNEQLMLDLSIAPPEKKNSVRSMISKNNSAIKTLRNKLGTYNEISPKGITEKTRLLKEINAKIAENIAAGDNLKQALNSALAKIDASGAEKQIIRQEVMEQVANGTPAQFAVQQAVQNNLGNDDDYDDIESDEYYDELISQTDDDDDDDSDLLDDDSSLDDLIDSL